MTPEERIAELETQNSQLRTAALRSALTAALTAAKCRPDGLGDAVTMLLGATKADFNAEGAIASLSLGQDTYESAQAAAEAFMASRSYLVAPESSSGVVRVGERDPKPETLVAEGMARSSTPAVPTGTKPKAPQRKSLDEIFDSGQSPGELATQGWLEQPTK